MLPTTYKVTVGRSVDYQKVEIEATCNTPLTEEGANALRKSVAKLADEAVRELTISQNIKKEKDEYFRRIAELEVSVSEFPVIESGENFGKIDVSKLDTKQKQTLNLYRKYRELWARTEPYNYESVSENHDYKATEK